MVTAHNYLDSVFIEEIQGAAHRDLDGTWSGRPQLVEHDEGIIGPILEYLKGCYDIELLINTSLNIHGEPIVFEMDSLTHTAAHWLQYCPEPCSFYIVDYDNES
jgi:predicted NodU family carbamoyl transferase